MMPETALQAQNWKNIFMEAKNFNFEAGHSRLYFGKIRRRNLCTRASQKSVDDSVGLKLTFWPEQHDVWN